MKKKLLIISMLTIFLSIIIFNNLTKENINKDKKIPSNIEYLEPSNKPCGYDLLDEYQQKLYDYLETKELAINDKYLFKEEQNYDYIYFVTELYNRNHDDIYKTYRYLPYQDLPPKVIDKSLPVIGIKATDYLPQGEISPEEEKLVENKINEIINEMPKNLTDLEKIQYLYDYVIENIEYYAKEDKLDGPYEGLVIEKAKCDGYARSFKVLAEKAGFNTIIVAGKVGVNMIGHMWNMIQYKGHWYHLDPTFDDQINGIYEYFMLSDTEHDFKRINEMEKYILGYDAPKVDSPLPKEVRESIIRNIK